MNQMEEEITTGKPNAFWYRVYLAVLVVAVLTIAALGLFTRYFSN